MANKEQKTMALDASGNPLPGQGQAPQKTMALDPSGNLIPNAAPSPAPQPAAQPRPQAAPAPRAAAPAQKAAKKSSPVKWIAGPLISVVIAAGTAALAGVVMPAKPKAPPPPPPKEMGKLKLSTDPPGAAVTIDGKSFPHFTPTEVEGEVGTTIKIGLKLDGYQGKEEEVVVGKGEHPFNAKLEPSVEKKPEPPPAPAPAAAPAPVAAAAPAAKPEHHSSSHHAAAKEPAGKGTISVFVRPWAIVFVDGTRLRQTPVQAYELPAGKHNIEIANDGKGKREKIPLLLKAGESQEIRRDWDK
jgi:hypothetical protein